MGITTYKAWRQETERVFAKAKLVEKSVESHKSPSGNYTLDTSVYSTGPHTWQYSRGVVRRVSDRSILADVKRNYGQFWHAWVDHPNGREYLLCGEDYQGYSVIDLSTGNQAVYFPDAGFNGGGFCWAAVHPSPDGRTLAVDGCYWGGPYDIVFFDFSDPMKIPLPELSRFESLSDTLGWKDKQTFEFTLLNDADEKHTTCWERQDEPGAP